ncbi:ribosome recycling factor [Lactiplantibacillus plantarum]|nr:ribosome recycling factor [Lactiplantibacillus plantarum]MCT3233024.1 ribosome recycling factor [Lactiplantibacillus plantarum]MCT3551195.1 ribosome recycling factor [Lactiplantibacillus plantarum]
MMTIADYTANLERKKDLVAETKSFLYAINRQIMI